MSKPLSHDEIAQKFVEHGVIDFQKMGSLIASIGPELALRDDGWHGIAFGRFNILACMLRAGDVARVVGNLNRASLSAAAIEGVAEATLSQ